MINYGKLKFSVCVTWTQNVTPRYPSQHDTTQVWVWDPCQILSFENQTWLGWVVKEERERERERERENVSHCQMRASDIARRVVPKRCQMRASYITCISLHIHVSLYSIFWSFLAKSSYPKFDKFDMRIHTHTWVRVTWFSVAYVFGQKALIFIEN